MKKILSLITAAAALTMIIPAFAGCSSETYVEYTLYDSSDNAVEVYQVSEDPEGDAAAAQAEGTEYEDITIDASEGSYFVVTGYSGQPRNVVIPESYGGVAVTAIGQQAFEQSKLVSVKMADSITSIGRAAFLYCRSLTTVELSASITELYYSVFAWCYSLEEIVVPEGVTSIQAYAFYGDYSLTNVSLPDSLTYIGGQAFYECTGLEQIVLPENLVTIGMGAFYSCTALNNVVIPDSVEEILDYSFVNCASLTDITIGSGLKTIGEYAFYYCTELEKITLPADVSYIGAYAFYYCSALTDVYMDNEYSDGTSKVCRLYESDLSDVEEDDISSYLYTDYNYYKEHKGDSSGGQYNGYIPEGSFEESDYMAELLTSTLTEVYWYFS